MKPRIYWHYYPKSRCGYWRVSLMPKPYTIHMPLWRRAHIIAARLNNAEKRRLAYRAEYAEQRRLRLTT